MEVRRLRLRINVCKLCSVAVMRFSMAITVLNYAFSCPRRRSATGSI
jgi:hypothetical protein